MKRSLVALLIILALLPASMVSGASCTLAASWNPNTEPDLAGYKVYVTYAYGGTKTKLLRDVGNVTSCTLPVILPGNTRNGYITVTAYDKSGNESERSDRVPFRIPARGGK